MCGIYGMVSLSARGLTHPYALDSLAGALRHRGPDAHRRTATTHGVIGATRLRIIDRHERADQPFQSGDETVSLVCNGEIYNAHRLRRSAERWQFRSQSDVEPLLPLYLSEGVAGLSHIDGMFALAVWDAARNELVLARDRAGEKPLFYARIGFEIWFASEFGALARYSPIERELDIDSMQWFLKLGYIPDPRTMFRRIRQVEPGTAITFDSESMRVDHFWRPRQIATQEFNSAGARVRLRRLLRTAVDKQMTADVATGVFTSGGLDSTILTALAARLNPELVTFTARFADRSYDESDYAEYAAQQLGVRNIPVPVDSSSLRHALDRLLGAAWLPLADPAVLPTILLGERARDDVGVVLTGEGADELFGGYPTYTGHRIVDIAGNMRAAAPLLSFVSRRLRPGPGRVPLTYVTKRFLEGSCLDWPARHFTWFGTGLPDHLFLHGTEAGSVDYYFAPTHYDDPCTAMLTDYLTYLPSGLLPKIDRATMLSSLEARAPFLDVDVTRFALSLPVRFKLNRLTGKWLLRAAFRDIVPQKILRRKKRGLSVPLARWMRNGLRQELLATVSKKSVSDVGLLHPHLTAEVVGKFLAGDSYLTRGVWTLFVFHKWFEQWTSGAHE